MEIFLVALVSYLSGSIPFGLLLTKIFGKIDIRKIGSGNIGTTNVLRTGNKSLAALTLFLDFLFSVFLLGFEIFGGVSFISLRFETGATPPLVQACSRIKIKKYNKLLKNIVITSVND